MSNVCGVVTSGGSDGTARGLLVGESVRSRLMRLWVLSGLRTVMYVSFVLWLVGVGAKWMVWLIASGGMLLAVLLFMMSVRMLSLVIVIGVISATIVGLVSCVNVAWWSRVDIDRSDVRGRLDVECVSGVVGGWMLR